MNQLGHDQGDFNALFHQKSDANPPMRLKNWYHYFTFHIV